MARKLKRGRQAAGGSDRSSAGKVGGPEDDNVGGRPGSEHDSRGSRGVSGRSGGSASFEVENDDYARNMGNQDRGRLTGGRSERDEDFTSLGRQSRFGNQGNQGSQQGNENYGRHSSKDDGNPNGGGGNPSKRAGSRKDRN